MSSYYGVLDFHYCARLARVAFKGGAHPQERSQLRLDSVAAKQRYGALLEPFHVTQTFTVLKLVRVIGSLKNGFPAPRSHVGANAGLAR